MQNIILNLPEKRETKKQAVRDKLVELIIANNLKDGDKLPSERELARLLGVSRNVLREAVSSLAAEGRLETRDRQGIFIRNMKDFGTVDSLNTLKLLPADFIFYQLELRTIISVPAARIAAVRRTDNDLHRMHECYRAFVQCPYTTPEEAERSAKLESLLHQLVTEAAHNPILSRVNESINALVEKNNALIHPTLITEEGWMETISGHHKTLIDAIERHDSKAAGDILRIHMTESIKRTLKYHPEIVGTINVYSPLFDILDNNENDPK